MGFKKIIGPIQIITNGVMTGTNLVSSISYPVQNLDNLGIQVSWTGDPVGSFSVVCSPDNNRFDSLTFDPNLGSPSGAAGGFLISLNQLPFDYLKLQYANVSGNGLLNAILVGKDLN